MALGWGIVGPGRIADTAIAPGIGRSEDGFLQAVVSRDPGRAEAFAAKHGAARATTSYEDMLADPRVDVVFIGTPNAQHPQQAIAAMRAGKHVLCDKPLALAVADAEEVLRVAGETGVKLGVGFMSRHHPAHQEARRIIRSGAIGDVVLIQAEFSPGAHRPVGWRTDPAPSGARGGLDHDAVDIRYVRPTLPKSDPLFAIAHSATYVHGRLLSAAHRRRPPAAVTGRGAPTRR